MVKLSKEQHLEYYKTNENDDISIANIDFEEVILKRLENDWEIEISGYEKDNISVYLWKSKSIIGCITNGIRCYYKNYENLLRKFCINYGEELRLDFKNKSITLGG